MIHIHELDGCAPAPLAHYLKALGILRLVAEDAEYGDPEARGWWDGERFRLASRLDADGLAAFFLERYQPTPLLAPWNGASGFFKTWDARAGKLRGSSKADALQALLAAPSERWAGFREAYRVATAALGKVLKRVDVAALSDKERRNLLIVPEGEGPEFPVADKKEDKAQVQRTMMRSCAHLAFYRSAIVDMGNASPGYPSLWGTGGNDGAFDFSSRFFENLATALLDTGGQDSGAWLAAALMGVPAKNMLTGKLGKVGQFLPGTAGGANSTAGFGSEFDTLLNPWDFILMLEGAVLFTAHATQRLGTKAPARAAAPFVVGGQGAGYASASESDEGSRGEQWMPLWSQPLSLRELHRLMAEGRAQMGAKAVREPLDMARCIARLGTARGIVAFQRYGYIERNGQSNLAVPLGRFQVPEWSSPKLTCLDDLDAGGWLSQLRREARASHAPARLRLAERRLSDALFAVAQDPEPPARWQQVLLGLAEVEAVMASGSGYKAQPVPKLRVAWADAAHDGSPEFRLALCFALQHGGFKGQGAVWLNGLRRHWLPLNPKQPGRFATSGTGSQARLAAGPEVVLRGRRGLDDAVALVERRLVEASQRGERRLPLAAAYGAAAHPADLASLVAGEVDLDRTLALARAFMALDRKEWRAECQSRKAQGEKPWPYAKPENASRVPDDAWLLVRLALLPWPLKDGRHIGIDPAIFRRLASGDAATAVTLALRRLNAAGIYAAVRAAAAPHETARLWAAALAFPISQDTAARFIDRIDPNFIESQEISP